MTIVAHQDIARYALLEGAEHNAPQIDEIDPLFDANLAMERMAEQNAI